MPNIQDYLQIKFMDNDLSHYCILVGILLFAFIFKRYLSKISNRLIYRLVKRYSEDIPIEKFNEHLHRPVSFLFLLIFIYVAFAQIHFPAEWNLVNSNQFGIRMIIQKVYLTIFMFAVISIIIKMIEFAGLVLHTRIEKNKISINEQLITFAIEITKILAVIIGILMVLATVFHLNIGSLIAGLGIGGLAVALAAKETLENLLGSFTIFFDKPFAVGDNVKVGNVHGIVEKIGFRSTRIRTFEKTVVTVPNKKMVDAELDNYSMRTQQKESFKLSLMANINTDQIRSIVDDIRAYTLTDKIFTNDTQIRFSEINNNIFEILVFYYVDSTDWDVFLKTKEEMNYKILEILKKHNAELASPSLNQKT